MKDTLFSIIVLHYNQPRYVLTALKSVLCQDYSNIELVFADDASTAIDLDEIKQYIEKNKKKNIKNVIFSINEQNVGTVKTVNRAVKKCNGEHILFFAADDALYDSAVISNFKDAFDKADKDVYMISSQCYMMDVKLQNKLEDFIKPAQAINFNKLTALQQYKVFCRSCFIAIGSTAMRRDMFEKFGYFDETYKFVEDWSYFLHLTRNGGLIRYVDFDGLLHRDGGVSHYIAEGELPPHVIAYKYDMLRIFEREIFPYLKQFGSEAIVNTIRWYDSEKRGYQMGGGTQKTMSLMKLAMLFPSYYIQGLLLPLTRDWQWTIKMIRISLCVALVYVVCVVGALTAPKVLNLMFHIALLGFGIILLITLFATLGIILIKSGLTIMRNMKKILRRVNK